MGTCRHGARSHGGVCNFYGQTHDVRNLHISDSSLFISSAIENPTLMIVPLARRQAGHTTSELARRHF